MHYETLKETFVLAEQMFKSFLLQYFGPYNSVALRCPATSGLALWTSLLPDTLLHFPADLLGPAHTPPHTFDVLLQEYMP